MIYRYSAVPGDYLRRRDLDGVEGARARQPSTEKILRQERHGIQPGGALQALVKLPHASSQQLRGFDDTVSDLVHWNPEEPVEAGWAEGHNEVPESAFTQRVDNAEGLWSQYSHRRGCEDLPSTMVEQVRTRYIGKMKDE